MTRRRIAPGSDCRCKPRRLEESPLRPRVLPDLLRHLMHRRTLRCPLRANAFTAARVLRMMTNSVTWPPTWKPNPAPPVPIAEGPLQPPTGSLAMTTPSPILPLTKNPPFRTRRIAIPLALRSTRGGIDCSGIREKSWTISVQSFTVYCIGAAKAGQPAR